MTDKKKQGGPAYAPLPPRYYIFGHYDVWDKVQMLKYADDTHELRMRSLRANPMEWPIPHRNTLDAAPAAKFKVGDLVTKTKGSQWKGRVVGTYSTTLTPEGYAVESSTERGSVQIYPAAALELVQEAQAEQSAITSESGTPPAEQQAAPKAAPTWPSEALVWEALQAYLKHDTNMEGMRAALIVGAAPQQEAQKPVAWFEYNADLNAWFLAYHRNPKAKTRPLVFGDTTPQPAPAPLSRDQIRDVFMAHGFTIKEGQTDLKQYVYDAAYALLGTKPAPLSEREDIAMIDAAMVEMANIVPPLKRSECARLIRAALAAQGGSK